MKYATLLTLLSGAALAADPTIAQSFDKNLSAVESEFVPLAEAMPANAYNFAPTAGTFQKVRTFAQQVKHVATINYMIAAGILGGEPPVDIGKGENGPDTIATKEQIVSYLKGSFAELHKAMKSLTAQNLPQAVPVAYSKQPMPRADLAIEAAPHCYDHYGQMVVYARMNGIVPPASR